MEYTTTKCSNCGFATRYRETGVPKIQLGMPLAVCPRCRHLILDSFKTEFEFMSEKKRKAFLSHTVFASYFASCVFFFLFGIFIVVGAALFSDGTAESVFLILIGVFLSLFSVYKFVKTFLKIKSGVLEQAIYASLKRTSDSGYVDFLNACYQKNGVNKEFSAFGGKSEFMKKYKEYETSDFCKKSAEEFAGILLFIGIDPADKDRMSRFSHH